MRGHEYVRDAVADLLTARVPVRLAAHLSAIGEDSPVLGSGFVQLADSLQGITTYPVILVRSTSAGEFQTDGTDTWVVAYEVEVVVACESRVHADWVAASRDRDRLLLAVREVLLRADEMPADVSLRVVPKVGESTGAAAESLHGNPLAAGTVTCRCMVTETLTDIDAIDIDLLDVELRQTADAGQPLDEAQPYDDDESTYDETGDDYDAGTVFPPAP